MPTLHVRERRLPQWSVARTVDQWPFRVVGEKRDHATCEWSVLLTVDRVSTVGD